MLVVDERAALKIEPDPHFISIAYVAEFSGTVRTETPSWQNFITKMEGGKRHPPLCLPARLSDLLKTLPQNYAYK